MIRRFVCLIALCTVSLAVDDPSQPSLTIYNQNFAVVRQELPLELKSGVNSIRVTDITMHLEPDSVILRDPSGKQFVQVLEQNYRADPVSESLLLSLSEGKTIDFLVQRENKQEIVPGKVIRSGYVPHDLMAMRQFGAEYYQVQMAQRGGRSSPSLKSKASLALACRERHYSLPSATTRCSSPRCNGCCPHGPLDHCGLNFHM